MMYEGWGPFNTREIATGFWLVVLFAWVMYKKPGIWGNIADVIRAFTHPKILASVFAMALYTAGAVWLLAVLNLWTPSLLKDTVFWFGATALVLMFRFAPSPATDTMFREVLLENLTIVIVLEFLVNTYTFSLPVELILVLVLTILAMTAAAAEFDEEKPEVEGCVKTVLGLAGLAIIVITVVRAVSDPSSLGTLQAFRSIALPPLLSILFLPCLYCLVVATKYDSVFNRLTMGPDKDPQLLRYARRRIFLSVGLSLNMIQRLLSDHAGDLMHIGTKADVDRLVEKATESDE